VPQQTPVQMRIGESSAELRSAELMAQNIIEILRDHGASLTQPQGLQRACIKRDIAYIASQAISAIDRLAKMMGATGQTDHNLVQHYLTDLRAMAAHGSLHWDKAMINQGKLLLGIETGDQLLDLELNKNRNEG